MSKQIREEDLAPGQVWRTDDQYMVLGSEIDVRRLYYDFTTDKKRAIILSRGMGALSGNASFKDLANYLSGGSKLVKSGKISLIQTDR